MLVSQCLIFLGALAILIKSSDYFVNSAEAIGKWFGIPAFVIGATIVALGTSLPELVTSLIAVTENSSEIVLGSVIGSNIANILFILGISALFVKSMEIKWDIFHSDLPMFFASGMMLCFAIWPTFKQDRYITMGESVILILGGVVYIAYVFALQEDDDEKKEKKEKKGTTQSDKKSPKTKQKKKIATTKKQKSVPAREPLPWHVPAVLVGSAIGIFLGAKYTIDSVIQISQTLEIAKEIIAISAVSIGTSLPELMVSVTAVRRGQIDMAFGNIAGSNIFNVFAVVGITGFFANATDYTVKGIIVPRTIEEFALPFMIFTYFLFLIIVMDKKITRMEGIILLLCYLMFIGKMFGLM